MKLRVKVPHHPRVTSSCPPSLLSEAPWFGSQPLWGCPELSQGGWLELGAETEQVHASRGEQGRGQAWREEPLGHWHIWLGGVLLTARCWGRWLCGAALTASLVAVPGLGSSSCEWFQL